jgi:hypothetical protein
METSSNVPHVFEHLKKIPSEFFIINQCIYLFVNIPEDKKAQRLWDSYLDDSDKPLKETIIELKKNVFIEYGVVLFGDEFKEQYNNNREASLEQLKKSPWGNIVINILGNHTSYVDVVNECMDLIRVIQSTKKIDDLQGYMWSNTSKPMEERSPLILITDN